MANGSRLLIYREKSHREFESHPVSFLLSYGVMVTHQILDLVSEVRTLLGQPNFGELAQLARASDLHSEGQRFDSVILHKLRQLAHLVRAPI